MVGTSQNQVEDGTKDDEHGSRHAGDQPPGPGRAAIGVAAAADHVEDRLVRHKANVQLAREGTSRLTARLTYRRETTMVFDLSAMIAAAKAERLANIEFNEQDRPTGEDHALHVTGQICAKCGRMIEPEQAARRHGEAEWVHDLCPADD